MNQKETLESIRRKVNSLEERVRAWNGLVADGHRNENDETLSALVQMLKFWEQVQTDLASQKEHKNDTQS